MALACHEASRVRQHKIGYTLWPASFELTEPGAFLDEALDEAECLGVDSVEIPLFCTRVIADGRLLEPAVREMERSTAGRRVAYSLHGMLSINLMDQAEHIPLHEQVARANIELAARLGAPSLVLHCGLADPEHGEPLDDAYARQRDSLSKLGDFAAQHDVLLCIENIWNFDGRETALPGRLAQELASLDHASIRATVDFAHAALQCHLMGADLIEEIRALAPFVHHIHLNDCYGSEKAVSIALPAEALAYGSGDLHLPIGWGNLPFERLLTEPAYPDIVLTLNQELHPTYWYALADDVTEIRRLVLLMAGSR